MATTQHKAQAIKDLLHIINHLLGWICETDFWEEEKKIFCKLMPVDRVKTNWLEGAQAGVGRLLPDHQPGNSKSLNSGFDQIGPPPS